MKTQNEGKWLWLSWPSVLLRLWNKASFCGLLQTEVDWRNQVVSSDCRTSCDFSLDK